MISILKRIIFVLPLLTMSILEAKNIVKIENKKVENAKWQTYDYPELNFAIDLPKKPETMHQDIEVPQTNLTIVSDTFMVEVGDEMVYLVSVWKYPSEIDLSNSEVNLRDGFKGMLSALPNAEVVRSKVFEKDGNKVLDFHVKSDTIHFQGFLMLVDHVLYQVFTVYKEGLEVTKDIEKFIDSFHLLKSEKKSEEKKVKTLKISR